MTYSNCWKPVHIVHVTDDELLEPRTLCGIAVVEYVWEFGGEVEDSTDGAMFTCERCRRALEKRERKARQDSPNA